MAYPVAVVISLVIASVIAFFICHNEQAEERKCIIVEADFAASEAA